MLLALLAAALLFEPSAYVRIHKNGGLGQGCVVEGWLLTARHVFGKDNAEVITWSDLGGREGRAGLHGYSTARDLVVLDTRATGAGLPRAKVPPALGSKLQVYTYNRAGKDPIKPNVLDSEVVAISAGHLYFKHALEHGDSGGCVVNEQGEVVAIAIATWQFNSMRNIDIGVALWGIWNPLDWVPPQTTVAGSGVAVQ